jgi:hypothetical protein
MVPQGELPARPSYFILGLTERRSLTKYASIIITSSRPRMKLALAFGPVDAGITVGKVTEIMTVIAIETPLR